MSNIIDKLSNIDLDSLITIFDVQIAIAIVVIAFLFKGVIASLILRFIHWVTKEKEKEPKESAMYPWLKRMILFVGCYIAFLVIPTSTKVTYIVNEIVKIIIILFIAKILTTTVFTSDSKYLKKMMGKAEKEKVNTFLCQIIRAVVWVIAIFIAMSELGIDLSGLVTGLGIGSAALVLAAQELVKNVLSGASILTDKPFDIGDWIQVGDFSGSVIEIGFRSTKIKTVNNTIVTIPNSVITSEYVINWNHLKSRRLDLTIDLDMKTNTEKIRKLVKEIKLVLMSNPNVIENTVQVNLSAIADCSYQVAMFMYINETDYVKYLNIKEEILCSLLIAIEKENVDLAYPTQTIYMANNEEENKGETK